MRNRPVVPNACPELAPSISDEPLRRDRLPIRVQTLEVPEAGVSVRPMLPDEVAQVQALVKCGTIMWVVLTVAALAFTLVGLSELALYQTGFSLILPALFILWLAFRLRKDYWEAASLRALRRDAKDQRLAVIVAVSPEINARLEVLPNSLYLWSVDNQPAPWRELRVRRDLGRG